MTLDDLKQESAFQNLGSDQLQAFVSERCLGKSNKEAAKIAWTCTTDASAVSQANRALKNPNVKFLLGRFFGPGTPAAVPTASELAAWHWERAKSNVDPEVQLKHAMCVAKILGYQTKPADAPPSDPKTITDDGEDEFKL